MQDEVFMAPSSGTGKDYQKLSRGVSDLENFVKVVGGWARFVFSLGSVTLVAVTSAGTV